MNTSAKNQMSRTEKYWRQVLEGFIAPTPLVVDRSLTSLSGAATEYNQQHIQLSRKETTALQSLLRQHQPGLEILVQGAWALLLNRYSGEEDVLFGVSLESTGGKILPVRVRLPHAELLLPWLKMFEDRQTEQRRNDNISLQQVQEWGQVPPDLSLFESVVKFGSHIEEDNYALILTASTTTELTLEIRYDEVRFEADTINRMLGHIKTLLTGMTADPQEHLANLPLLTEKERQQMLVKWNETQVAFPEHVCLHQLFEAQVKRSPDAIAVIFKNRHLTYNELNHRSNQLANYLSNLGVGPGVLVGVVMDRSLDMVVALYGILKAGGAYVPLDPSYPKERLAFMVEDTGVPVLLTQRHLADRLPAHNAKAVMIDAEWQEISREGDENPDSGVTPEHRAYIIYTSGSTGTPKAAVLNHRGRVNNFCDFNRRYSVECRDRVLGLASLSFDMHAYDIFGIMAAGGTTVVVETADVLEPARWAELMIQHEITVWHSVPALLEMFVNHLGGRADLCPHSLRLVLLGGDWIPVNLPDRLKAMVKGVHMVSMGGATECSMDSTIYDIEAPSSNWKSIPYGVPMANQLAYVLDSRFNALPIGVPGELYLGGIGVGSGYLNRAQLTAEKFVPNPFSGVPGDRMYRTGDLVRYMLDGNLELLGRIDFQVKVRGYRVELGEIASTLCQHSAVKEALVVANDIEQGTPSKGKQLVAYVVQKLQGNDDEGAPSNQSQTEHISQWQQIYAETYSETSDTHDPTFNIIGWNSSYTGLPIPLEEMREWVDQSIQRILALQPTRILELACGTGLLLFKVAPHCEKYVGVDFSNEGLNYIRQQLARPELDMSQVTLLQRMADNFEGIEPDSFDLVILHSVVQLFPGIDYLLRVLEGAINAVQPGGFIYVGDVISLPLLEAFHTSVQLFQAPSWVSKAELRQRVQKAMNKEEQLFLDPAFFTALMQHHPKITQIEIQLRRGRFLNEMTRFRFDVVLHIGGEIEAKKEIQWLDWQEQKMTISAVHKLLTEAEPEIMGIAGVPNSRLAAEVTVVELLASSNGPETVEDMRATLDQMTQNGFIDPEDFWAISDKLPYDVSINWSTSVSSFDVLFRHRMAGSANLSRSRPPVPHGKVSIKPWSNYANNPLQSAMARRLVPELRTFLQEKLPDYMAPSTFVLLDALPLSPNGKVDRRALPPPDQTRPEVTADFVSPRNPVEEVVASIWAEVFDFEQVGIHDNFLEMGGHSLLAIQIMSRLLDVFPVELPLRYLFASPNVAELVKRIEEAGNDAGVEVMEIARMLISVAQLSDQKVKSILAGEADDTSILKQL